MDIAGWVLIGLGIVFLGAALIVAAREEVMKKPKGDLEGAGAEGVLTALASVLKELGGLPKWLALAVLGIGLIVFGTMMVAGRFPASSAVTAPANPT